MNNFNFINNPQNKKPQSLKKWFYSWAIISILILIVIGYLQFKQMHEYKTVKREHQKLLAICENQQTFTGLTAVEREKKDIEKYLKKEEKKRTANLHKLISSIAYQIPGNILINTIKYANKEKIMIEGSAKTVASFTQFIRELAQQKEFKSVNIEIVESIPDDSFIGYILEIELSNVTMSEN